MNRNVVAVVSLITGLVVTVYVVSGGSPAQQAALLADAGFVPTHVAECPVRISDTCLALAADAGYLFHPYTRLRFPISMRTTVMPVMVDDGDGGLVQALDVDGGLVWADGGTEATMPPLPAALPGRGCVQVTDWTSCVLAPLPPDSGVVALWGAALPFSNAGVVERCVRPHLDAGLTCLRALSDGGTYSFGDRNVFPRAQAADPATCEPVSCVVYAGDDPETSL